MKHPPSIISISAMASSGMFLRRVLFSKPQQLRAVVKPASLVRFMSTLQDDFENAKSRVGTLKEDPGNDVKLEMYALFKQVG